MPKKLPTCSSRGQSPTGEACDSYVRGYCRSTKSCPYQAKESIQEIVRKKEHVDIPDRVTELLSRIAGGNFQIDEVFQNSDTYRALYQTAEITAKYDPLMDKYESTAIDDVHGMEQDAMHLVALNLRLGQILSQLQADVEGAKCYLDEIKAKKEIEIEGSMRQGLRSGGYSESRVRSAVLADAQVAEAQTALLMAKRRKLIVENTSQRAESMVNMIKVALRRRYKEW